MPRKCRTCDVVKPLNKKYFRVGYVRKSDGKRVYNRECLVCVSDARRKYYQENRDREISNVLDWQATHPDSKRMADHRYYQKNQKKWRDYAYRKHGLSTDDIDRLLLAQGYRCGSCKQLFDESTSVQGYLGFCVDHDHRHCPGDYGCRDCVRGLLCDLCNRALGFLRDDPMILRSALEYLELFERRHQNGTRPEQYSA